jgi:hypothetical protein
VLVFSQFVTMLNVIEVIHFRTSPVLRH